MNEMTQTEAPAGMDRAQIGAAAQGLIQDAKALLYGEHFENMMDVFSKAGKQGFAEAMGTVIVGVLDRLEADSGEQDPAVLLVVAIGLVAMLTTDLVEGQMLPDLNGDDVQMSLQAVIGKWMKRHPDRANPEEVQRMVAENAMQQGGPPAQQGRPPMQQPVPAGGM